MKMHTNAWENTHSAINMERLAFPHFLIWLMHAHHVFPCAFSET